MDTTTFKSKASKKFIVSFVVIALVILSIILFFVFRNFEKKNDAITTFTSNDSSFSLSIYDSLDRKSVV